MAALDAVLPRHAEDTSATHRRLDGGAPASVVALVDDEEQICMALQEWLQLMDIPTRYYLSAEALLSQLTPKDGAWWVRQDGGEPMRLRAAVLDLNLPGMHGFALGRLLREAAPALPVVVITAAHNDERDRLASEVGGLQGLACLSKPFDLEALEQALALG